MKKATILTCFIFLFTVAALSAQTPANHEASRRITEILRNYREGRPDTWKEPWTLFDYSTTFPFEGDTMKSKLRVRVLADKKRYDEHLVRVLDRPATTSSISITRTWRKASSRPSPPIPSRSGNVESPGFIQFQPRLRSHPPLWLRKASPILRKGRLQAPNGPGRVQGKPRCSIPEGHQGENGTRAQLSRHALHDHGKGQGKNRRVLSPGLGNGLLSRELQRQGHYPHPLGPMSALKPDADWNRTSPP